MNIVIVNEIGPVKHVDLEPTHLTDFILTTFESDPNITQVLVHYAPDIDYLFYLSRTGTNDYDWARIRYGVDFEASMDHITTFHRARPGDDDYNLRLDQAFRQANDNGIEQAFNPRYSFDNWLRVED